MEVLEDQHRFVTLLSMEQLTADVDDFDRYVLGAAVLLVDTVRAHRAKLGYPLSDPHKLQYGGKSGHWRPG